LEAAVIDQVDARLTDWIRKVLGSTSVSLSVPRDDDATEGIDVHLMEIVRRPSTRSGPEKPPLQVTLRYLVTSNARDASVAHRRLWDLIVLATQKAEQDDWTVELEPIALEAWSAFGIAPRPAFILGIPLRHDWAQRKLPVVKQAPTMETSATRPFDGRVVGPEDLPFVGVTVELPLLGLSTVTGKTGNFHFAAVPAGEHFPKELLITTKGRRRLVPLDRESNGHTLIIRTSFDEGDAGTTTGALSAKET
jgi:hypothetical protein